MAAKLQVELAVIDKATKELNSISREFNNFQSKISAIGGAVSRFFVGGAITSAVIKAVSDLRTNAQEYTAIQNQMREALGYTSIALNEQAEAIEDKLKIDDREVLKAQAQLSMFSQDEDALKSLTAATVDYAVAKRKNLGEATEFITKAINSEKGTLKGFPGVLDGASGSSERLASITETLNKYFHGQAKAVAESKDFVDDLKISYDNLRDAMAVSLFGKADEKEALRYRQAKAFIEKYTTESESFRKINADSYQEELRLAEEYEKKIGDAKIAAQKKTAEAAAATAGKSLNLTPGFKDEKAYSAAMKKQEEEKKKLREQALKEEEDFYKAHPGFGSMTGPTDFGAQMESPELKIKQEKMQGLSDLDKQYLALVEEDKVAKINSDKEQEDDARRHAEVMTHIAVEMGAAYGQAIGENIGKGKEGLKRALKEILILTISFVEKQALAAVASVTLQDIGKWNIAGFLTAAAKSAPIIAVAEGLKGAINSFAGGTQSAPGGWSMVGEHGPENMFVPRGAQIYNATETKNMQRINNNSGHTFNINIQDSSGNLVETMTAKIRAGSTDVDNFVNVLMAKAGMA